MKTLIAMLVLVATFVWARDYPLNLRDEAAFMRALSQKESRGDSSKVGDTHLRHKAYGDLQIRYVYLKDVNRIAGKDVKRKWGKQKLVMQDMKVPAKAMWAAKVYLYHYGRLYTQKTGLLPTEQIYARIHNGGPTGWQDKATQGYWRDLCSILASNGYWLASI